jgi:peptidoglycan/LPS O-acetylase OafA/YrhL
MNREYRRKSQLAFGIALICILFLLETWNADRQMPNPASPLIWAVLGTIAAVALVATAWFRHKARPPGP